MPSNASKRSVSKNSAKREAAQTRAETSCSQLAYDTPGLRLLKDLIKDLPTRPSPATVWRWRVKGRLLRDGSRVYLPSTTILGKVYSTRDALAEFLAVEAAPPALGRSAARAEELRKAGLL